MIYWCLCILALKVVKSFDDGGLRLTDKSWTPSKPPPPPHPPLPPPPPPSDAPHLSQLLSYELQRYFYSNPLLFYFIFAPKVQAGGRGRNRGCLSLSISAFVSIQVFFCLDAFIV